MLSLLDELRSALDDFEILGIDDVVDKMSRHTFHDNQKEFLIRFSKATERSDTDKCAEVLNEWKELIAKETV